jgi:hypothetical protein
MLENYSQTDELKFKELSPEEKSSRGILGRLYGPIASIVKSTRNGRRYTEALWEKVFKNPITQEMFEQGGVPGELDHPIDREETDSTKIAIMMPEAPTKDKDGHLVGYFDIIDTPCGRIAYALAKYGFNLGISSRGTGDTYMDENGEETVDEDTYSFNAFDLVLLPACKDARLSLAESLDVNKANFKKALQESLDNSNEQDKKIMTEVLESLDIDFEKSTSETEVVENAMNENLEAGNTGDELVKNLQESLIENKRLQSQIVELQEKLSVSYTKEVAQERDITKLKLAVKKLSESANKGNAMSQQLQTLRTQLEEKVRENGRQAKVIDRYKSRLNEALSTTQTMESNLDNSKGQVQELSGKVKSLNESVARTNREHQKELSNKDSEISSLREELDIKNAQYSKKLKSCNTLIEKFKKTANEAVTRYINMRATTLGVSANEIKNRLSENFTFDEIDEVCESLRSYKRNMSKLPFNLNESLQSGSRVVVKEDQAAHLVANPDDVVDKSLLSLLNN